MQGHLGTTIKRAKEALGTRFVESLGCYFWEFMLLDMELRVWLLHDGLTMDER